MDDSKLLAMEKLNSYKRQALGITDAAYQLGAPLEKSTNMYKDVQERYCNMTPDELDDF